MIDDDFLAWIALSHDELAAKIRESFQPLVDAFNQIAEEWNIIPPKVDHRRRAVMRRKIRKLLP